MVVFQRHGGNFKVKLSCSSCHRRQLHAAQRHSVEDAQMNLIIVVHFTVPTKGAQLVPFCHSSKEGSPM